MEETIAAGDISAVPVAAHRQWRVLNYIGLVVLAGWAAYAWLGAVQEVIRLFNPFPTWDYWRVVQFLERYQAFDARVLWMQHNEHRIVFPELVFASDMLLFRGRLLFPVVVSALCYAAAWALLCYTVVADKRLAVEIKLAAVFLTAAVVGWKGIAVVLAVPFLLQWTLLEVCVVGTLLALWSARRPSARAAIWISIVLATVATYTSGNGMFLWPVLVVFAFLAVLPWRRVLLLAIFGVVCISLYFVRYTPSHDLDLRNFWMHPIYVVEFIGAYLGMPLGGIKGPLFGPCVGLVNLVVTTSLAIFAWKANLLRSRPAVVLFGSYLFVFLSLLIIAAGRMGVRDSHFSGAEAPRYLAVPLLNWATAILLLLWISARLQWKIISPVLCCVLLAILVGLGFPKLRWWLKYQRISSATEKFASLAVANGVHNYQITRRMFPDPGFVAVNLPKLQKQHLSIFSQGPFDLIGRPLSDAGRVSTRTAPGAITYGASIEGGIEMAGWSAEPGWIILVDRSNRVVGLGENIKAELPHDAPSQLAKQNKPWFAFASTNVNPASISAYVINRGVLEPLKDEVVIEKAFTASWK